MQIPVLRGPRRKQATTAGQSRPPVDGDRASGFDGLARSMKTAVPLGEGRSTSRVSPSQGQVPATKALKTECDGVIPEVSPHRRRPPGQGPGSGRASRSPDRADDLTTPKSVTRARSRGRDLASLMGAPRRANVSSWPRERILLIRSYRAAMRAKIGSETSLTARSRRIRCRHAVPRG
jgi:hypothetical protein